MYGTILEADSYFSTKTLDTLWANQSDDRKSAALERATILIDTLRFSGSKTSTSQENQFPRDGDTEVPVAIERATYEVARAILDGRDVEYENEDMDVDQLTLNRIAIRRDLNAFSEPKIHGIPSKVAWDLLLPFLSSGDSLTLRRKNEIV